MQALIAQSFPPPGDASLLGSSPGMPSETISEALEHGRVVLSVAAVFPWAAGALPAAAQPFRPQDATQDARSDVWALAATLLAMATGCEVGATPSACAAMAAGTWTLPSALAAAHAPAQKAWGGLEEEIKGILQDCLALDPAKRPTLEALLKRPALRAALEAAALPARSAAEAAREEGNKLYLEASSPQSTLSPTLKADRFGRALAKYRTGAQCAARREGGHGDSLPDLARSARSTGLAIKKLLALDRPLAELGGPTAAARLAAEGLHALAVAHAAGLRCAAAGLEGGSDFTAEWRARVEDAAEELARDFARDLVQSSEGIDASARCMREFANCVSGPMPGQGRSAADAGPWAWRKLLEGAFAGAYAAWFPVTAATLHATSALKLVQNSVAKSESVGVVSKGSLDQAKADAEELKVQQTLLAAAVKAAAASPGVAVLEDAVKKQEATVAKWAQKVAKAKAVNGLFSDLQGLETQLTLAEKGGEAAKAAVEGLKAQVKLAQDRIVQAEGVALDTGLLLLEDAETHVGIASAHISSIFPAPTKRVLRAGRLLAGEEEQEDPEGSAEAPQLSRAQLFCARADDVFFDLLGGKLGVLPSISMQRAIFQSRKSRITGEGLFQAAGGAQGQGREDGLYLALDHFLHAEHAAKELPPEPEKTPVLGSSEAAQWDASLLSPDTSSFVSMDLECEARALAMQAHTLAALGQRRKALQLVLACESIIKAIDTHDYSRWPWYIALLELKAALPNLIKEDDIIKAITEDLPDHIVFPPGPAVKTLLEKVLEVFAVPAAGASLYAWLDTLLDWLKEHPLPFPEGQSPAPGPLPDLPGGDAASFTPQNAFSILTGILLSYPIPSTPPPASSGVVLDSEALALASPAFQYAMAYFIRARVFCALTFEERRALDTAAAASSKALLTQAFKCFPVAGQPMAAPALSQRLFPPCDAPQFSHVTPALAPALGTLDFTPADKKGDGNLVSFAFPAAAINSYSVYKVRVGGKKMKKEDYILSIAPSGELRVKFAASAPPAAGAEVTLCSDDKHSMWVALYEHAQIGTIFPPTPCSMLSKHICALLSKDALIEGEVVKSGNPVDSTLNDALDVTQLGAELTNAGDSSKGGSFAKLLKLAYNKYPPLYAGKEDAFPRLVPFPGDKAVMGATIDATAEAARLQYHPDTLYRGETKRGTWVTLVAKGVMAKVISPAVNSFCTLQKEQAAKAAEKAAEKAAAAAAAGGSKDP